MNRIIIHISGVSGSGKTTIGNKLKKQFKKQIIVKDIDDLRREFIEDYYGNMKFDIIDMSEYQLYIDKFVKNNSLKPLIFVGLNNMPWWHSNHYYDMHSTYNYFIDLDDITIIKQKCKRLLLDLANSERDMDYLVNNNIKFIKNVSNAIAEECNLKKTIKQNNKWRKYYEKHNYNFMSRENIFKNVSKILKNI
jgi:septum formation inhibitor-activating ATPase MinD